VSGTDLTRSTTYAYGPANELTHAGATTYAYDADGNQTSNSAGQAFAYNAKNQATSYTPLGGGPLSQNFLGEGQAERTTEGATRLQYSQLLGLGTRADATGVTSFTRDPGGRLIGERRPDGRYYYLFDGLGSVTGLTNAAGALVRTYRYEPYGTQHATTGTGPQAAFRFAGGYLMPGGLYHFGQRYTDTTTGRWTQQDPLDSPSDLTEGNRYLYGGDNPVNLTDPSGLTAPNPCGWVLHARSANLIGRRLESPVTPDSWDVSAHQASTREP
jgi:RHS repeat-associated protein